MRAISVYFWQILHISTLLAHIFLTIISKQLLLVAKIIQKHLNKYLVIVIISLENGYWLIGDKHQNVGGLRSQKLYLENVPLSGWLYNDGTKWNYGDPSIKVYGDQISIMVLDLKIKYFRWQAVITYHISM